jgi:glycosyltransferase involved in cell wall biosynthesis
MMTPSRVDRPVPLDFVCGADGLAPGLARAEAPLLQGLRENRGYLVRTLSLPTDAGALLFGYSYGILPIQLWARRRGLVYIANSWYAHVVPIIQRPSVVTCHDLIEYHEKESGERAYRAHRRFHLRAALAGTASATRIVCDSAATADALMHLAPRCAERVRVIHCGIDPIFTPGPVDRSILDRLGVRQPYVLFVGSDQPRKNISVLIEAAALARRSSPALHVVKVGRSQTDAGRSATLRSIEQTNMHDAVRLLDSIEECDLVHLYRGAVATVLLSREEGFGYPPVESMACGTPAIVSTAKALVEVTGTAALTVDAYDVRGAAGAIERLISDSELASTLRRRGLERSAHFTWDRTVSGYFKVFDEVVAA